MSGQLDRLSADALRVRLDRVRADIRELREKQSIDRRGLRSYRTFLPAGLYHIEATSITTTPQVYLVTIIPPNNHSESPSYVFGSYMSMAASAPVFAQTFGIRPTNGVLSFRAVIWAPSGTIAYCKLAFHILSWAQMTINVTRLS